MKTIIPTISLSLFTLMGCTTLPNSQTLDKNHFKQAVVITDETAQSAIGFSTVLGTQLSNSSQTAWNDNFLRGFIHKRTGTKTYQVYNVVYYSGAAAGQGWKSFYQATYQTSRGTKLTPILSLKKEENCATLERYGQCVYGEQLSFTVEETFLRTLVKTLSAGDVWHYYLVPKTGKVYSDQIAVAEIAGLLERMNEYQLPKTSLQTPNSFPNSNPAILTEPLVPPMPTGQLPPS